MIVDGLLGLFIGPVILAVGYVLLIEWMDERRARAESPIVDRAA
jgi:predicted PurR-regulated permease PerM